MNPQARDSNVRLQLALCVSTFLAALNFFAISPFTSRIADDLGTSVPLVGQIATIMILVSAVLGLVIGPVSDHIGQRIPLVIGVVAVGANLIGISLAHSYAVMLLLGLIGGLADALVFNLPFAIIGKRLRQDEQGRAMSWTFASLSAAPILGVPIMTAIGAASSWRWALTAAGAVAIVCAWFVLIAVPPDPPHTAGPLSAGQIGRAYLPLLHDRSMVRLLLCTGTRSMCWLGAIAFIGAFLSDRLHLGDGTVGLVFTAAGIGNVSGSLLTGRVRSIPLAVMTGGACIGIAIAVVAVFATTTTAIVVPAIFVASALSSIGNVSSGSLLIRQTRAGAGTTMVLNGSLLNLGTALGTALSGILLGTWGYRGMAAGLPVFALIAAVLAMWPAVDDTRATQAGTLPATE